MRVDQQLQVKIVQYYSREIVKIHGVQPACVKTKCDKPAATENLAGSECPEAKRVGRSDILGNNSDNNLCNTFQFQINQKKDGPDNVVEASRVASGCDEGRQKSAVAASPASDVEASPNVDRAGGVQQASI